MTRILSALFAAALFSAPLLAATPNYSIQAIRYATSPDVPVAELVVGGPANEAERIRVMSSLPWVA